MRVMTCVCGMSLICVYNMTHSCVWHDSLYVWYHSYRCATRLIHMCAMTYACDTSHALMWHNAITYFTWLVISWHSKYVGSIQLYVSFAKEPYKRDDILKHIFHATHHIVTHHMCDVTPTYVWRGSFIYSDSFMRVTWLIRVCGTFYVFRWYHSYICLTRLSPKWLWGGYDS